MNRMRTWATHPLAGPVVNTAAVALLSSGGLGLAAAGLAVNPDSWPTWALLWLIILWLCVQLQLPSSRPSREGATCGA